MQYLKNNWKFFSVAVANLEDCFFTAVVVPLLSWNSTILKRISTVIIRISKTIWMFTENFSELKSNTMSLWPIVFLLGSSTSLTM